jgi:hypothetical protein
VRAGLVDLRCAFVEPPLRRKVPRVLDRRRGVSHGGAE